MARCTIFFATGFWENIYYVMHEINRVKYFAVQILLSEISTIAKVQ